MNHMGTLRIETDRLILRKFNLNDSIAAFTNWTSDDRVTEFLRWTAHQNEETTKSIINTWIDNYMNKDFYQWAIVLKESNEAIGTISVVDKDEQLDLVHIGYCIGFKWWNKGITSEAFSSIISFLFEQVKVNRIESQHDTKNPNSGKVMLKCGLKYEGTLREADISNKGTIIDVAMYSILAKDYYSK